MNRTLMRLTTLPARLPRTMSKVALLAVPATLLASHAFAQAANTLGGRMQAASTDLTMGGGFVLEILGYLLGGTAMLACIYTIWQHSKNPNGQARFGYGLVSVLAGGAIFNRQLVRHLCVAVDGRRRVRDNGAAGQAGGGHRRPRSFA